MQEIALKHACSFGWNGLLSKIHGNSLTHTFIPENEIGMSGQNVTNFNELIFSKAVQKVLEKGHNENIKTLLHSGSHPRTHPGSLTWKRCARSLFLC